MIKLEKQNNESSFKLFGEIHCLYDHFENEKVWYIFSGFMNVLWLFYEHSMNILWTVYSIKEQLSLRVVWIMNAATRHLMDQASEIALKIQSSAQFYLQ